LLANSVHAPSQHVSSAAQTELHDPQWVLSANVSKQAPLQQDSPAAQAVVQSPQYCSSVLKFLHRPLHSSKPFLHAHVLLLHSAWSQQSRSLSQF
jgi:hypothetical protein